MNHEMIRYMIVGASFLSSIIGFFIIIFKIGRFVEKFTTFETSVNKEFGLVKAEIKNVSDKIDDIRDRVSRVEGQEDFSRSVLLEMVKKKN